MRVLLFLVPVMFGLSADFWVQPSIAQDLAQGVAQDQAVAARAENATDFSPLTPPAAGSGNTFTRDLAGTIQRTKGTYLPEGAPLDVKRRAVHPRDSGRIPLDWDTRRVLGALAVALVLGFLLYLIWRSGWMQSLLNARRKTLIGIDSDGIDGVQSARVPRATRDQILAATNPRLGLQMFMRSVLERAAQENKIPLRRAMTGREILRRLPPAAPHKDVLGRLLRMAEPVLFGDDTITADELRALVEQHGTLLTTTLSPPSGRPA
ncbi:MAG: DUF4129 domain-containing protein [Pseudomonadota bacterium]